MVLLLDLPKGGLFLLIWISILKKKFDLLEDQIKQNVDILIIS